MAFEIPHHSRTQVDRAGRTLLDSAADAAAVTGAYGVLANWRAAHAFPLNTITMDLRQKARRVRPTAPVVQRLKRTSSILSKLARETTMRLSQMQDIGGCRVVVNSLADVASLRALYSKSRSLHQLAEESDYLHSPKRDGYRSVHLIYRFQSRSRPEFDGLLLEVQLRTRIQHAWATAVETVGAIVGQALKANEGEAAWLGFFRNASAAFALSERSAPVPDTPTSRGELARALAEQLRELDVRGKLEAYRKALRVTSEKPSKSTAYYLLVLNPESHQLRIRPYSRRRLEAAYREYGRLESSLSLRPIHRQQLLFPELADSAGPQVVLVGAESMRSVRSSYPNYYADTEVFLRQIETFVRRNRRAK